MTNTDKTRENRLRDTAKRQGLRLEKSRRRDPRALDYGTFQLVDVQADTVVAHTTSFGYGLSLDDVEKWLSR